MKKTASIICGAALAAAPCVFAQTASPAQPAAAQTVEQAQKRLAEVEQTLKTQLVTMAGSNNTFTFVSGQMFNGNPVKGQPYSAEAVTESTQMLPDGNRIVNRSSTMRFRDSEGRERREESISKIGAMTSSEPAKVVFISDPVTSMSYTLHTAERTAEKRSAPARPMAVRAAAGGGAATAPVAHSVEYSYREGVEAGVADARVHVLAGEVAGAVAGGRGGVMAATPAMRKQPGKVESLGTQNIEGVVADGTRTTTTIPAGQIGNERDINIVSESWYSKELGMVVMSKHSDPRTGDSTYKLTNISRSEPSRAMFEIPGDYTVTDSNLGVAVKRIQRDDQ
jgi:hypothetical protein